jgi:hypothetical protein
MSLKASILLVCSVFYISAQTISYPSGPKGCSFAAGYQDPPFCTIPNETPLGNFVPPAPGGSYVDYNFGGKVTLITGPGSLHTYSTPSPFSAHNKYLVIREEQTGKSHIVNAVSGAIVYPNVPFSGSGRFWDAYDDEVYYYVGGTNIVKYTLNTQTATQIVDYATNGYNFTKIVTGGSSDTTKDNWMAFWAPNEHKVCAVDLGSVRTYCADYTAAAPNSRVGWDFIDYVLLSKGIDSRTNKRYVLAMATPAMGAWSVNLKTGNLDYEFRGPENPDVPGNGDGICDPNENCLSAPHSDTMEGPDGRQYLVESKGRNEPCELNLVALDLSTGVNLWKPLSQSGGRNVGMNLAKCGDVWPDHHIGCAKSTPYCVLSTMTGFFQKAGDTSTPISVVPHRDELILMHGPGLDFTRLAMSRSVQYADDNYWTQVRAALSNDASVIAFDSNFGNPTPGTVRVATASTGVNGGTALQPRLSPSPAVTVSLSPANVTLSQSQSQAFSAAVANSGNTEVSWSLSPAVGAISASGSYTAPAAISAAQTVTVKATSIADPSKSATAIVSLSPVVVETGPTPGSSGAIRVNSGGESYTDPAGQVWSADTGFMGYTGIASGPPVSGTNSSPLYQSVRYGDSKYDFPVTNGTYTVTLKFAEFAGLTAGTRIFHVLLNGTNVLPFFDIAAAAGGPAIAVDRSIPVKVSNGNISVQLEMVKYGSIISAIEIVPGGR